MSYVYIRFKNGLTGTYNMDGLKITSGFVKIYNDTYGNVAIPRKEIESLEVVLEGANNGENL